MKRALYSDIIYAERPIRGIIKAGLDGNAIGLLSLGSALCSLSLPLTLIDIDKSVAQNQNLFYKKAHNFEAENQSIYKWKAL